MDGKGRWTDNVFIERLWCNIKYEKIYLEPSEDGIELYEKIKWYIEPKLRIRVYKRIFKVTGIIPDTSEPFSAFKF